jgi:N-acyl-D-aspartate/D-glutamate deacylase
MVKRSRGVEMTIVNGEVIWEKGALTGAAPGSVLRS